MKQKFSGCEEKFLALVSVMLIKFFLVSKAGRCPDVSLESSCDEECSSDSQCPGAEKCCYNGCGTQCLRPEFDEDVTTPHPQPPQGGIVQIQMRL